MFVFVSLFDVVFSGETTRSELFRMFGKNVFIVFSSREVARACKTLKKIFAREIFFSRGRYLNPLAPRAFIMFDFEQMECAFLSQDCDYYYIYCY